VTSTIGAFFMNIMYDAVDVSQLPSGAKAYAGYVDGIYQTYNTIRSLFPEAQILSIAVLPDTNAECLDVEPYDATVSQIPAWLKNQTTHRPVIYASVGTMGSVLAVLAQNNISRQDVRLWSAHYLQGEHICGPHTCGQVRIDMDGTQWTDKAHGRNLDQSLLRDDFFSTPTISLEQSIMNKLPVIKLNYTDADKPVPFVKRVQAILNDIYGNHLIPDGVYGPITMNAVKALQVQYHLTEDGIVGPATWQVLYLG
jgi:peptidoglycan hydrolase-like protein with peptidoglycan-binding domain